MIALLRALPQDAAVVRSMGEVARWTQQDELAALQVEATVLMGRQITSAIAASVGQRVRVEPFRIPRPGEPKPDDGKVGLGEFIRKAGLEPGKPVMVR